MRLLKSIYGIILTLATMATPVQAEFFPWNMPVSSSFRVGYLYGSQVQGCHSLIETEFGSRSTAPYVFIYVAFSPFGEIYY